MDSTLPPYLVFHESYRFIACQIHQTALHPTRILDHVTQDHQGESIFLENLDLLPLEIIHQEIQAWQPVQPLKGLLPPRNGFQCSICSHIRLTVPTAIAFHIEQQIEALLNPNHMIR